MNKMDFGKVKYSSNSDEKNQGELTPNDEFWDYSAASKSVFMFDDDDDDSSWEMNDFGFENTNPQSSIGSKTSANNSSSSTFQAISKTEKPTLGDTKSFLPEKSKRKVASVNNLEILPAGITIKRILQGESYILELYKSKDLKLALLDSAIDSNDGNAIIAVLLHLKRTLKTSFFNQEVRTRPIAISHYISYLKNHYDFNELYDFLTMLGRMEEASMLKLRLSFAIKNTDQKIQSLKKCLQFHFMNDSRLNFYTDMVNDQIDLLQKQSAIAKNDEKHQNQAAPTQQNAIAAPTIPYSTLIGMPVITSLYYCTLYHYPENENSFSSPISIKKSYKLSDKQYTWTVVTALAKNKDWNSIQLFLTTKGLFGGSKLKSCIGFEKVAELLFLADAPPDATSKYLKQMDSIEDRLSAAKRFQCHNSVIDTYVLLKDAQGLLDYKNILKPGTHEYSYIENALRASTVRWKN